MLDTLTGEDYRLLVTRLEPEVAKARRNPSGKHVLAVEKKIQRHSRNNSVQSPSFHVQSQSVSGPSAGAVVSPVAMGHAPLPQINLSLPEARSNMPPTGPKAGTIGEPAPQ